MPRSLIFLGLLPGGWEMVDSSEEEVHWSWTLGVSPVAQAERKEETSPAEGTA